MAVLLVMSFVGAGLYLRGFYIYFQMVRWIHQEAQSEIRRRYWSSVLAAAFREPELAQVKTGLILAMWGVPLFAVSGLMFNALKP